MKFHSATAIGLSVCLLCGSAALAQTPPPPANLTVRQLQGTAYWVSGGIANTGFVIGDKGIVTIDPQITPADTRQQLDKIGKISSKPVTQVIVTHADPDHVGGLPALPRGIGIIAHENTRAIVRAGMKDLSAGPQMAASYQALAGSLPTRTIAGTETIELEGVTFVLMHLGPAHTSADLVVYVPSQKVVFAGDLLVNSFEYPVIHDGGSSQGWIDTMKAMIALDATVYVPGHGPVLDKTLLIERLAKAEQRRSAVKAMVLQGKSWADVQAALPEAQTDPRFPTFTAVVFEEIETGYPKARSPWAALLEKK